ncbi:hypothetical protein GGS23DRAFT_613513 [Durotheca rogersii]|uniref:uncharacterized protein n=1 Tax=Durotheca rogersii TaxID=419775 RepID=UPI002220986C|nr:uncharacterized protein GGS23DRAFT_613513 [Durotheca rogersii]KAI5860650.1 hypothetical protein GGS23DRAFT_613513 [Durotheca rogersii]
MAEEPTLPKLPTVSWDSETQTFTNTRKRARDRVSVPPSFNNSSDPAVFSSDDDPHVDNYTQGKRRKRRYVGSWFQQHLESSDSSFSEPIRPQPKTKKRTFERQFDSGVWMGSDSSMEVEEEEEAMQIEAPAESRLPQLRHARPMAPVSPRESAIRKAIQTAIDQGNPAIDLSSCNIEHIPNGTISQLSEFAYIPVVAEDVPFQQEEPRLQIYLAKNPLLRAPGALFNLEYLTVLSLRNTQITELPPSIGNLRNLETLNVSLTRLRYLPGELLGLMRFPCRLHTLNIHPNPFYVPDHQPKVELDDQPRDPTRQDSLLLAEVPQIDGSTVLFWLDKQGGIEDGAERSTPSKTNAIHGWSVSALARSRVQFKDGRGVVVSKFRLPSSSSGLSVQTEDLSLLPTLSHSTRNPAAPSSNNSRVLSLFELSLQSCSRTTLFDDVAFYTPPNSPPHLAKVLNQIALQREENANYGDMPCSVCKRRVMVPTVEWIEWWEISKIDSLVRFDIDSPHTIPSEERAVPFLRQGCSWACLPSPMKFGQSLRGTLRRSVAGPEADI